MKCQVTPFYPLPHLLGEWKPKPELVLQQFHSKCQVQPPVTHPPRWAAWLLLSLFFYLFLLFLKLSACPSWIPGYPVIANQLEEGHCWEFSGSPTCRWTALVRGVRSASAPQLQPPFPAEGTGGFHAHTGGLAFTWGQDIIAGTSPGRSGCKRLAFTWTLH